MSFNFADALDGLRTKTEFDQYVSDYNDYLASPAYALYQQQEQDRLNEIKEQNVIAQVLASINADGSAASSPVVVNVADLMPARITELETVLQGKGFTTSYDSGTNELTIQ